MKSQVLLQPAAKFRISAKLFLISAVLMLTTIALIGLGSNQRRAGAETLSVAPKSVNSSGEVKRGPMPMPQDPNDMKHALAAAYYDTRQGVQGTVMLSNQGPHQIEVQPTLFNLKGDRFDAPPKTLEKTTPYTLDIAEWVNRAGPSFQEGSLQVTYTGKPMEIGGVVQLVQASRSWSFDEEVNEPAFSFSSSRLEGVWWFPSRGSELNVVVSNTSELPVVANLQISGNEPKRSEAIDLSLNPHETRKMNLRDLLDKQGEALPKFGGISISHSGTPGAIIARGMISNEASGFSSVVDFSDPGRARSSRVDGAGVRIGRIGKEELSQIIVARNTGTADSSLNVRIPFTKTSGETGVISLPELRFSAGETKLIDPGDDIRRSGINGIATAGLEFEYSGAPGSMTLSAYSVSRSGNQTFRVLLVDPASLHSSAGTYPWSITPDSATVVYIKNVTNEPQDFVMTIRYGTVADGYSPAIQTVAPGQTQAIDLRKLRDEQVPDAYGRTLPRAASDGQVHWSTRGRAPQPLIGRAEQVNVAAGISMTAACGEPCCGDVFAGGFVSPGSVFRLAGASTTFVANEQWQDCFGSTFTGAAPATFASSNPEVATCDSAGNATGVGTGSAFISAVWHYFSNRVVGDPYTYQCYTEEGNYEADAVCDIGYMVGFVDSPTVPGDGNAITSGQRFSFRLEVRHPDNTRALETDGSATFTVSGGQTTGEIVPSGINIVAGAGAIDVTLRKVLQTGDSGRTYHSTFSWGGGSTNTSGDFNVYFPVTMDTERWKNCNFTACPNLGSYFCTTACAGGFAQQTEFMAVTSNTACNKNVKIWVPSTGRGSTSAIKDVGPSTNNTYWLSGDMPTIGGCLTEVLMTNLGVSNGCNPNHGQASILWRFN